MKQINELHGLARRTQSYSAYGYLQMGSDAALGFNGERADKVLQGYALGNGHRIYSPALMRFFSPDKLSPFDAGGMNPYGYCKGDPVNLVDPTGQIGVFNSFVKKARGILNFLRGPEILPAPLEFYSVQSLDVPESLRQHHLPASLQGIVEYGFKNYKTVRIYQLAADDQFNVFTYDTSSWEHQTVNTRQERRGFLEGFVGNNLLVDAPGIPDRIFVRAGTGYLRGRYRTDVNGRPGFDVVVAHVRRNAPKG